MTRTTIAKEEKRVLEELVSPLEATWIKVKAIMAVAIKTDGDDHLDDARDGLEELLVHINRKLGLKKNGKARRQKQHRKTQSSILRRMTSGDRLGKTLECKKARDHRHRCHELATPAVDCVFGDVEPLVSHTSVIADMLELAPRVCEIHPGCWTVQGPNGGPSVFLRPNDFYFGPPAVVDFSDEEAHFHANNHGDDTFNPLGTPDVLCVNYLHVHPNSKVWEVFGRDPKFTFLNPGFFVLELGDEISDCSTEVEDFYFKE